MRDTILAAQAGAPQPQANGAMVIEFCFRPDDPVFAGHFPGRPILPGVFQLELARVAAELATGFALSVAEISKAKFTRPILPGEILRVEIKTVLANDHVQARAQLSVNGQAAGESLLLLARSR